MCQTRFCVWGGGKETSLNPTELKLRVRTTGEGEGETLPVADMLGLPTFAHEVNDSAVSVGHLECLAECDEI